MAETNVQTPRGSADDRRLKNLLIAPSRQFRFAFIAIGIGLVTFFGFFGFQLWLLSVLLTSVSTYIPPNSELNQLLGDSLTWSWVAFALVAAIFSTLTLIATFVISHRLYGPAYAMRKHIEALKRGEFTHRTHLRKQDEFKDLAKELNELSEVLEARESGHS